jgi:hypothetical protein
MAFHILAVNVLWKFVMGGETDHQVKSVPEVATVVIEARYHGEVKSIS